MLWEIRGTRNNQPIRAKVSASSEESATRKAQANGIVVQAVLALESRAGSAAPSAQVTPASAPQPSYEAPAADETPGPSLDDAEMNAPSEAYQQASAAAPQWPANPAPVGQPPPYLPPAQVGSLQYGVPGTESGEGISGLSIASLICGGVATCLFCLWPIAVGGGLAGLTLGIVAWVTATKKQNRRDRGFAIAGTCVSTLPFIIWLTIVLGLVALVTSGAKRAASIQKANAARQSAIASQSSSGSTTPAKVLPTPAELQAKLAQIPTYWKPGTTTPVDLTQTMRGRAAARDAQNGTLIRRGDSLTTREAAHAPVSYRIIARTDEKDFRLELGGSRRIIFNWEMARDDLVVEGFSNDGHVAGAGRLPDDQWTAIELIIKTDEVIVYVDGDERYRTKGDFTKVNERLRLSGHGGDARIYSVMQTTP